MLTLNKILNEINDIPLNRLEEIYQFVHSLNQDLNQSDTLRKKILSFGGAFSDMSQKDFADYQNYTKKARTQLFDRKTEL